MAIAWKLGKFIDGSITREDALPVKDAGSSISVDINGEDTTELAIAKSGLTSYEANNWQEVFQPITTILIAVDTEKEWDDPFVVPFVGFVNKITDQIQDGIINVQLTSLSEYTKARIVADSWANVVTDPTTEITFSGDTWTSVIIDIVTSCFSQEGIPAGKPKPPTVIGNMPAYTDGAIKKSVRVADAKTYYDVLQEVKNDNSGTGLEYRFKPRFRNAGMTDIAWDLIVGTSENPHIGEDITIELELADNDAKFSKFSATIDSNSVFSKMYIQSKAGDEETKEGADFTQASVDSTKFPILVERFFNPGVELTDAEIQAQLTSRLKYSIENSFETSFTLEEKNDISQWLGRLGSIITVTGVDDTISAGHSAEVRCVGLTFTPGTGTISVDVMQIQPSYPRLPKDRVKDLLNGGNQGNSSPIAPIGGGSGGGGTPSIPSVPSIPKPPSGGTEGIWTPDQKWGDIGHNPWDTFPPPVAQTLGFDEYMEQEQVFSQWEGKFPIHPFTVCSGTGNRLYGLDSFSKIYMTDHDQEGNELDYPDTKKLNGVHFARDIDGELDLSTGKPINGIEDVYIKKTYMAEGEFGEIVTAGMIPKDVIEKSLSEWTDSKKLNDTAFIREISITNFIVDDTFYVVIGTTVDVVEKYRQDMSNYVFRGSHRTRWHSGKAKIFSSQIDTNTGMVSSSWKDLGKWDDGINGFPLTPYISRTDKQLYFTKMTQFHQQKMTTSYFAGQQIIMVDDRPGEEWFKEQVESGNFPDEGSQLELIATLPLLFNRIAMNWELGSNQVETEQGLKQIAYVCSSFTPNTAGGYTRDFGSVPVDLANPYIKGYGPNSTTSFDIPNEDARYPGFKYPYEAFSAIAYDKHLYATYVGLGKLKLNQSGGINKDAKWEKMSSSWRFDPLAAIVAGNMVYLKSSYGALSIDYKALNSKEFDAFKTIPNSNDFKGMGFAEMWRPYESWDQIQFELGFFVPGDQMSPGHENLLPFRTFVYDNRIYVIGLVQSEDKAGWVAKLRSIRGYEIKPE